MCEPRPGPRCSPHAYDALLKAVANLEGEPHDAKRIKAVKDAQYAYNTTPQGIQALRDKGNDLDADHFTAERERQLQALKTKQTGDAKEAAARLAYANSEKGIADMGAGGHDELADRLTERLQRTTVGDHTESTETTGVNASVSRQTGNGKDGSLAGAIIRGGVRGGLQAARSNSGGIRGGLNVGLAVGRTEAHRMQSSKASKVREEEKAVSLSTKEVERRIAEQERQGAEQKRLDKKLDADALRWAKDQEREHANRERADKQRKRSPKHSAV